MTGWIGKGRASCAAHGGGHVVQLDVLSTQGPRLREPIRALFQKEVL